MPWLHGDPDRYAPGSDFQGTENSTARSPGYVNCMAITASIFAEPPALWGRCQLVRRTSAGRRTERRGRFRWGPPIA